MKFPPWNQEPRFQEKFSGESWFLVRFLGNLGSVPWRKLNEISFSKEKEGGRLNYISFREPRTKIPGKVFLGILVLGFWLYWGRFS